MSKKNDIIDVFREGDVVAFSPKVSVIVPVYKVEKYLPECIESVLAQTFTDFELILVDDGSPDNSGKICDDYAARDPRIRVFHKENGGVTSARRLGVENAKGEWVMFVDSDDKLFPHALDVLIKEAEHSPMVDLVEGCVTRQDHQACLLHKNNDLDRKSVSGYEYALGITSYKYFWYPYPVAKIIRKRVLIVADALNIPLWINFGEDVVMNLRASRKIRVAMKLPEVIYFYRKNPEGACCTVHRTARYYCDLLKEIESIQPNGLSGGWRGVWLGAAQARFVEMFLWCADWDSCCGYGEKIFKELSKECNLPLGVKICLWIEALPKGKIHLILKFCFRLLLNLKNSR